MKYHIRVSSPVSSSFRAAAVMGKFDVDLGEESSFSFDAELPTDRDDWQIGLIVGQSGSGKSLLAKEAFGDRLTTGFQWQGACILDDFPAELSTDEITRSLTAVGLSSTPVWLLPYRALSNGQRFRADLARALATRQYIVYDEFTSVVDRDVARAASVAVAKEVRRHPSKRFVAVTCHADVAEWLEPDWIFFTEDYRLARGSLRRPQIEIGLYLGNYRAYPVFANNHYLSRPIPKGATVILGVLRLGAHRQIVAIDSYHACAGIKGLFVGGQGVVLPEFQGLGIGMRFFDAAAELVHQLKQVSIRNVVGSQVVNEYWARRQGKPGAAWRLVSRQHRNKPDGGKLRTRRSTSRATNRLVCSWEYIPESSRH